MKTLKHTSLHQQLVTSFFQHFGHHFMYFPEEVEDTYIYNESGNFCFFQPEKFEEILKENGNIIAYRTIPENDECEEHSAAWGFLTFIVRLTNCLLIILLRKMFHIRPQWLILFHRCSSATPASKNGRFETNLKPPPMKLFQNPNS